MLPPRSLIFLPTVSSTQNTLLPPLLLANAYISNHKVAKELSCSVGNLLGYSFRYSSVLP